MKIILKNYLQIIHWHHLKFIFLQHSCRTCQAPPLHRANNAPPSHGGAVTVAFTLNASGNWNDLTLADPLNSTNAYVLGGEEICLVLRGLPCPLECRAPADWMFSSLGMLRTLFNPVRDKAGRYCLELVLCLDSCCHGDRNLRF